MKPSLYLLIPALFLVSCDQQEVATQEVGPDNYDDCITQTMQGVSSDVAARAIIESCQNQFPTESQAVAEAPAPVVVDASRLVRRDLNGLETRYEINSDTPFTGVSLTYHENGQVKERVTFKDGKENGLREKYYENGQLGFSVNYKDGLIEGTDFSDLEPREDVYYEIGSDTPFTGVAVLYERGLLTVRGNFYQGVPDGIVDLYDEFTGMLLFRENYKDGTLLGLCFRAGCTDFN